MKQKTLKQLPLEILHHIFEYFSINDLGYASRVCQLWNQLSTLDLLWKNNSKKYFKSESPTTTPNELPMLYDYYKSLVQQQHRLQLFALQVPTSNIVYTFDPFTRFCARGSSLDESLREFWHVMSFLGIQHEGHKEHLIEARPHHGETSSTIVREGLFVTSDEECYDVYLIYYLNNVVGKILDYPITCFCPALEVLVEYEGHLPAGNRFSQQATLEREMASKMQAALSSKIDSTMRFVMWDKSSILCTKMHRIIEEGEDGKSKRAQYWFGDVTEEEEITETEQKPCIVYVQ